MKIFTHPDHLEEATEYARKVLGNDYIACDTPAFRALWQNFLHCRFVDANGEFSALFSVVYIGSSFIWFC